MEVRVLGPLELLRDGEPVALGARMERALLTILLLEGGRVVPADRLVDLLWPDAPPVKATASLHSKIAHLRRALQPERIVTAAPGYRLPREGLTVDADRFEALAGEADGLLGRDDARALRLADEALALWRGPAFGEFGGEPFARAAADRLELLRLATVELRARALLHLGSAAQAVAALQAHVAAHPLREQARALLARAHYAGGRQADALAVLAEGRRRLRDELGLDPGPDLRRLEQQILDHDPALAAGPARPRPRPIPAAERLHGRDAERALLARTVAEAAAGTGAVVLLTGEAGMGKSALLSHLAALVTEAGGSARTTTCRDGTAAPPFWPVLQIIRQAAADLPPPGRGQLARALGPLRDSVPALAESDRPAGPGVDPAMVLVHLSDGLRATVGADARDAPARLSLLALDDIHQADPSTLQLVNGLADDVAALPTVLALALRSGEGGRYPALVETLARLGRAPRLVRIDLGPLPAEALTVLVRTEAPADVGDDAVAELVARAGGNPFFAQQLARGTSSGVLPAAVLDALRQRLLHLPPGSAEVLAVAAVVNGPFDVETVAVPAGLPADEVLDVLEAAVDARLVVDAGDGRFALAHALVGEALCSSLSSARLARLHRALGDVLSARLGNQPEEAARIASHHLAARSLDGGAAALPWLARAADHAASVSALGPMRDFSVQVLDLLDAASPAGRAALDPHRRAELRARGRVAYADVWSAGFDSPPVREYIRLVRGWAVPRPAEPDDMELLWLATLLENQVGRLDEGDRTVTRMLDLARDPDLADGTAHYLAEDMAATVRMLQGRPVEALEHVARAEEVLERGGVDLGRSLVFSPPTRLHLIRAISSWLLGDRRTAAIEADEALRVAGPVGLGAAAFARRWSLVLALMDGDPARVRQLLEVPVRDPVWERFRYPSAIVRFAEGWLRVRDGDPGAGMPMMREAYAALVEQGVSGGQSVLLGLLAEATLAAGDARRAAALCEAALEVTERGERYFLPALERIRAAAAGAGQ